MHTRAPPTAMQARQQCVRAEGGREAEKIVARNTPDTILCVCTASSPPDPHQHLRFEATATIANEVTQLTFTRTHLSQRELVTMAPPIGNGDMHPRDMLAVWVNVGIVQTGSNTCLEAFDA